MSHLNWSKLNGASFESLVQTMLLSLDAKAHVFGRPGKDCGIDAMSGDRTTVYQVKFGQNMTMNEVIRRAKEECARIIKYKSSEDSRRRYWENVKQWTLVANVEVNINNVTLWEENIVALFKEKANLEVKLVGVETLESLLHSMPEIKDAYFDDLNRSFLMMPEVCEKLKAERFGNLYFNMPLVGRDQEQYKLKRFLNEPTCRFILIVGNDGVGKTKFLVESAFALLDEEWRVLWCLPNSMKASSHWTRSINTSDKVCLFVENLDQQELVDIIFEQLLLREKANWKVVASCNKAQAQESVPDFKRPPFLKELPLEPLDGTKIQEVIGEWAKATGNSVVDSVMKTVERFAEGRPGLALYILSNIVSVSSELQITVSETLFDLLWQNLTERFHILDPKDPILYKEILCWISMWRVLAYYPMSASGMIVIDFLASQYGLRSSEIIRILDEMVSSGTLVRWGSATLYYAVEPHILRHVIIARTLFTSIHGKYVISETGYRFVATLLNKEVPYADSILTTISTFSSIYLDMIAGVDFMAPIMRELEKMISTGSIEADEEAVFWLERLGRNAPAEAIDILHVIYENKKPDVTITDSIFGSIVVTHKEVITKIASCLYAIAPFAVFHGCAEKCWTFMFKLMTDIVFDKGDVQNGNDMDSLVRRLLIGSEKNDVYADYAMKEIESSFAKKRLSPAVLMLVSALSNPVKELTGFASSRAIIFCRRSIIPGEKSWERTLRVRNLLYDGIKNEDHAFRLEIIRTLAKIHGLWYSSRALGPRITEDLTNAYNKVLLDDLEIVLEMLESTSGKNDLEEANVAREVWCRHLAYERCNQIIELSHQCEEVYKGMVQFEFPLLLSWGQSREKDIEIEKFVTYILAADSPAEIAKLFDGLVSFAQCNQASANNDWGAMDDIAEKCASFFRPNVTALNAYTEFVFDLITHEEDSESTRFRFITFVLRQYLKATRPQTEIVAWLSDFGEIVRKSPKSCKLLQFIYSDMPEDVIGGISEEEFDFLFDGRFVFSPSEILSIVPVFLKFGIEKVVRIAEEVLSREAELSERRTILMSGFIRHIYLSVLRCEFPPENIPAAWLLRYLINHDMDGRLFASYDLYYIIEAGKSCFGLKAFKEFVESRIRLEHKSIPYSGFSLEPHGLEVEKLFFDDGDKQSFEAVCRMVAERYSYVTAWVLPKYLAELDKDADKLSCFVECFLARNDEVDVDGLCRLGNLASSFVDTSIAWGKITGPICRKMRGQYLQESEKRKIYLSFRPKTWSHSTNVGEVPKDIVNRADETRMILRSLSPTSEMKDYWKWADEVARHELQLAEDEAKVELYE